ncbi:hypothetical protein [Flavobacterium marginilacus]|uniref:hypothetical protein n=1 Tax=Flavobacterium marginilacus TaxID=3003256 RepID=UPI00248D91CF|nr:hypothetical protein [Flavobacterium marginilacus]
MDGIFKKLVFIFLFLAVLGCKKGELQLHEDKLRADKLRDDKLIAEARNFINENCNILIDSVEGFDVMSLKNKIRTPTFTIGLMDSISYRGFLNPNNYLRFKLEDTDLVGFKSVYRLKLVKAKTYDSDVLFVVFSDFKMEKDYAYIRVKKVIGISMLNETYYFKKENGRWVFKNKRLINMG